MMMLLLLQPQHLVPRAMAYDPRHTVLVVAGDGGAPGVDTTFSVWQLDKDKMHLLGAYGSPKVRAQAGRQPHLASCQRLPLL